MNIFKIGNVELSEELAQKYYEQAKYICGYTGIYQIFYSQAQNMYYGQKVLDIKGMARRGRFYALSGKEVNHVIGKDILN